MLVRVDNPGRNKNEKGWKSLTWIIVTFVDVIFAWIIDDILRNFLFISKYSLVVFESCQIAVHHLGVIPHSDLVTQIYNIFLANNFSPQISGRSQSCSLLSCLWRP